MDGQEEVGVGKPRYVNHTWNQGEGNRNEKKLALIEQI